MRVEACKWWWGEGLVGGIEGGQRPRLPPLPPAACVLEICCEVDALAMTVNGRLQTREHTHISILPTPGLPSSPTLLPLPPHDRPLARRTRLLGDL